MSASWDGTTRFWDIWSQRELLTVTGGFTGREFGTDDRSVNVYREMRSGVSCQVMDLISPAECRIINEVPQNYVANPRVQIGLEGRLLSAAGYEGVTIWDTVSAKKLARLPIGATAFVFFQPGSDALITSSATGLFRWPIRVNRTTPAESATAGSHNAARRLLIGPPTALSEIRGFRETVLSADGNKVAAFNPGMGAAVVVSLDGTLSDRTIPLEPLGACHLAVSADGGWLVTSFKHGIGIKVWNARTGELIKDLDFSGVSDTDGLEFSPDNRRLLTINHDEYAVWECGTWTCVRRQSLLTTSVGDSVDLRGSIEGSRPWHSRKLIDPETLDEVAELTSPHLFIGAGSFIPSSGWLAEMIAVESSIQLWDLRRVRANLAEMGLDWDAPPYLTMPPNYSEPIVIEVDLGSLTPPSNRSES